jgi:hypothetical protein
MGTTLTGTTPQDTYDSLIKVTDNGPIGATAKLLTDGLGNDSVLYLGTAGLGIKSTSVLSFNVNDATHSVGYDSVIDGSQLRGQLGVRFSTGSGSGTERMRISSTGNVGIGTSSPNFILETGGATGIGIRSTGVDGVYSDILSSVYSANANEQNAIQATISSAAEQSGFRFQISNGGGVTTQTLAYQMNRDRHIFYANGLERARIDADGLKFNGDTLAVNALDDYEEGTFTATMVGGTFATAPSGFYTKIGNRVFFTISTLSNTISGASGAASLTGLPFTAQNVNFNYGVVSLTYSNAFTTTNVSGYVEKNSGTIFFTEDNGTIDANFSNGTSNRNFM